MKKYKWETVLFADEKTFCLETGPRKAWQETGNRRKREKLRHPKKIHVWGAIGYHVKAKLYIFEGNMDGALYRKIIKSRLKERAVRYSPDCPSRLRGNWKFVQDNDPKHTARVSSQTLENILGTRILPHPPNSPDLNPIEDIWSHLDRKLKASKVTSIQGLKRFLNKEWESLSWNIRKSVESMPRRLDACLKAHGGRTQY